MDALTHMLTEPLDPKEENVGHITEECTLGNCRVNLPEDLLEDVSSIIHSPVLKCHPLLWVIHLHAQFAVQMLHNNDSIRFTTA